MLRLEPNGGAYTPDETWKVDVTLMRLEPENKTAMVGDDGSCKKLLSDACIDKIEKASADIPQVPQECRFGWTGTTNPTPMTGGYSRVDGLGWLQGTVLQKAVSPAVKKGNTTFEAALASHSDMVYISWGRAGDVKGGARIRGKLVCLGGLNPWVERSVGGESGAGVGDKGTSFFLIPIVFSLVGAALLL
ncbi:hypothetical protein RJ55_03739 [Drechmeria coniospora]|nr:hypothetical protein RJ55_03739 [Drechmeria coniospora]